MITFSTITGISTSLTLATGNGGFGRDGLREGMRLGALDISGSVTSFTPTSASSGFAWNKGQPVSLNDASTYRTHNFIASRLSLSGANIPAPSIGFNPVLVLQSGFQVSLDYQSPNGQWYSYSFLQGNNATNTWITANPAPGLCLATSFSQYGQPTAPAYTNPTIVNANAASL